MNDTVEFIDWLTDMMNKKGWSQADLARKTGLNSSTVSMVMTGTRKPGSEVCRALAKAFDLPEIYVFSMAGLLTPIEYDEVSEEFRVVLHELSREGRTDLMQVARMILKWEQKAS